MRTATARMLPMLATVLALAAARPASADEFPLKDGDVWVMAGDSITAQHLHTNYMEAFCYARYPKLTFRIRNSGVGGNKIPDLINRFDYDVAAWKPTIVSVELGMNDKGQFTTDQYIENMGKLTQKIQAVKARPVFFTASPMNDGSTMDKLGGNARLNEYAIALKKFAAEQKAPFADQFHALIDVWGKNKARETTANEIAAVKALAQDDKLPGVEHLKAFLAEQTKDPNPPVSMKGDAVHPGEPGQLMMAAALLSDLGADGFVSSACVECNQGAKPVCDARGCTLDGVRVEGGGVAFDRLDDSIPFPIPDEARSVLPLAPTVLQLSDCSLAVGGLKGDRFTVSIDGKVVAMLAAGELKKGVNLTAYGTGPYADQGKEVLAAVKAKEDLVGQWRNLSKAASAENAPAKAKEGLENQTKKVEEADAKIREAAKPRKHHFEIAPAK
ncbi:MAG TPA: GDSL-type esterase/lipase family protein [Gemmataceae bacterium]|nr:GDSL-type esterase/lipase family protein [Gemmataceae bacterium]